MSVNLTDLTIREAHKKLVNREFSVRELVESYIKEISSKNKDLNAYLEVFPDALSEANNAQKEFDNGSVSLLTGIPIALKDNILVKGKTATAGSKILSGFISTYDSTAAEKLKSHKAVILGRTNMDEFAMGSSTENSAFGVTKNPHDSLRVAGGSSGGSVAAVAANLALAALGSETGGSVRQPASFCGVVGLKPTYGAISRHGLIALGSSLDQIGPAAKTVADVEIVFDAIKGQDPNDSTSFYQEKEWKEPKTIGVPRSILENGGIHYDVMKNFEDTLKVFEEKGFNIIDVNLPTMKYSLAVYYVILPAEASSNLARFDGVRYGLSVEGKNSIDDYFETRAEGFGREPRRRIILGTFVLSSGYYDAYYSKAESVRRMITSEFEEAFKKVDLIATPTTPAPSFKIGEKVDDPLAMYLEDIFTVPANVANICAISLPSGFSEQEGKMLPLGIQLMADKWNEKSLFYSGKKFLDEK